MGFGSRLTHRIFQTNPKNKICGPQIWKWFFWSTIFEWSCKLKPARNVRYCFRLSIKMSISSQNKTFWKHLFYFHCTRVIFWTDPCGFFLITLLSFGRCVFFSSTVNPVFSYILTSRRICLIWSFSWIEYPLFIIFTTDFSYLIFTGEGYNSIKILLMRLISVWKYRFYVRLSLHKIILF